MERTDIHALVKEKFGEAIVEDHGEVLEPFLVIKPESIEEIAMFCRDEPRLRFDLLSCVSGIDYPERKVIEVVYCLDSTAHQHWLILKALLPRDDARIHTVESVWRAADWHER